MAILFKGPKPTGTSTLSFGTGALPALAEPRASMMVPWASPRTRLRCRDVLRGQLRSWRELGAPSRSHDVTRRHQRRGAPPEVQRARGFALRLVGASVVAEADGTFATIRSPSESISVRPRKKSAMLAQSRVGVSPSWSKKLTVPSAP